MQPQPSGPGVHLPPTNHPPLGFQFPDLSKPPPGFPPPGGPATPRPAPNSQPNVPPAAAPPPPEPAKPTVPYYDLPAGLMAPLVKV